METKSRSFAKAVSYRIYSSVITAALVFIFTRRFALAVGIGVTELVVKVFTFFIHERVWALIPYGQQKHPLAEFNVSKPLTQQDKAVIEKKLSEMGYLGEGI
jgi:adenylylsulfate kinase